ncbi:O-antigen ligase family protein [Halogranum rubrum]|nr:O-antigen ligase family protein [Halogranum salarium]
MVMQRKVLYPLLGIFFIFIVHTVSNPDFDVIIRTPTFVFTSLLAIFYIPRVIPVESYYRSVSRICAVLVIIGLPAIITGSYDFIISIDAWHSPDFLLGTSVEIYPLTSFLDNPNNMGILASFGAVAGLAEYQRTKQSLPKILFVTNILGVYLTLSRAAFLALGAILALHISRQLFGFKGLLISSLSGSFVAVLFFLQVSGLIPGPEFITQMSLNGRVALWDASFEAVNKKPLFGWGPGDTGEVIAPYVNVGDHVGQGPHNSFVRMAVDIGYLGGLLYAGLWMYAVMVSLSPTDNSYEYCTYYLVVGFVIFQLFGGMTMFGLSSTSVLGALVLGYTLRQASEKSEVEALDYYRLAGYTRDENLF